jgi:hypothetical protein
MSFDKPKVKVSRHGFTALYPGGHEVNFLLHDFPCCQKDLLVREKICGDMKFCPFCGKRKEAIQ